MIGTITANLLRFVLLLLVQVLVLDHVVVFGGLMVPYLYVLALLMLPFETPRWAALLLGGILGFAMDVFSGTPGMHFGACVVAAFLRTPVLRLVAPRDGYEFGMRPNVAVMGLPWAFTYLGLLVLAHHLWLFFIEVFRFDRFGSTLLRAVLSAAFTLALALLVQYLVTRPPRDR